jgi:hypothetical protein
MLVAAIVIWAAWAIYRIYDYCKNDFRVEIVGPHKGFRPPPVFEVRHTEPDTNTPFGATEITHTARSYPLEYAKVEASEKLEIYEVSGNTADIVARITRELIAKFGVLRVTCLSDEAVNCRASLSTRLLEQFGTIYGSRAMFREQGYLNWYSQALEEEVKIKFRTREVNPPTGLNEYLRNATEHLKEDEPKDLRFFYMIKDPNIPIVFLCTDVPRQQAGWANRTHPLKFEARIRITAEKLKTQTELFAVTVRDFDDYEIQRLG